MFSLSCRHGFLYHCNCLTSKTCLQNDLLCVNTKPYSLIHFNSCACSCVTVWPFKHIQFCFIFLTCSYLCQYIALLIACLLFVVWHCSLNFETECQRLCNGFVDSLQKLGIGQSISDMFGMAKPEWEKSPGLVVSCQNHVVTEYLYLWVHVCMCDCVCVFDFITRANAKLALGSIAVNWGSKPQISPSSGDWGPWLVQWYFLPPHKCPCQRASYSIQRL